MSHNASGFNTRFVHAGQEFEPHTGAVVPPVHFSTTYAQEAIGKLRNGYEYGRGTNPTRASLQEQLGAAEGGRDGFSFGSGLAARDSMLRAVLRPGDHIGVGQERCVGAVQPIDRVVGPGGVGKAPRDL